MKKNKTVFQGFRIKKHDVRRVLYAITKRETHRITGEIRESNYLICEN